MTRPVYCDERIWIPVADVSDFVGGTFARPGAKRDSAIRIASSCSTPGRTTGYS
jgi:hypothetical protein